MLRHMGLWAAVAGAMLGQAPVHEPTYKAPAEVEAALKARVQQFFQYHVDGNFRAAYGMVAEDTKDFYFAAGKSQLAGFTLGNIRFVNPEFTKATVDVIVDRNIRRPEFPNTVVPLPETTMWKMENGAWVWYRDAQGCGITPMGCSDLTIRKAGPAPSTDALKQLTDPDAVMKMGQQIIGQSKLDTNDVTLAASKASTAEVKFHNGQPGWVKLTLNTGPKLEGFTAELDKTDVAGNQDATIKLRYTPVEGAAAPAARTVTLYIAPFNQQMPVRVRFADAK